MNQAEENTPYPQNIHLKLIFQISNQFDDKDDERRTNQLKQEIKMIQGFPLLLLHFMRYLEASTCEEVVRLFGVTFHEGDCLICMEFMDVSLDLLYKIVHREAKMSFNEDVLGIVSVTILRALNNLKELKHIIHR